MTILQPIQPTGENTLALSSNTAYLVYELPEGSNWATVQLDSDVAWTAAAVVVARIGNVVSKQHDFKSGAVYFTELGAQDTLEVTGWKYLLLKVSAAVAGTCVLIPTVNAGRDG